ncbi:MAG: hypothetical protein JWP97_1921 [Labilithrix sp.]|nr:hypothetical protein [Labilithrix sp.]
MLRFFRLALASSLAAAALLCASPALADRVAVLPFDAPKGAAKPELAQARAWTREAAIKNGHVPPSESEMLSGEMAVKDGTADTSVEYQAAGRASGAQWTLSGHLERHDAPPAKLPDGTVEEGYTTYRLEIEACNVATGRVESLAREIDPDEAPGQIAPMLALLLRPEGIANAPLPWDSAAPHKRKAKPAPPPPPPPPPAPPPPPPPPAVKHAYAENHPAALGVSAGYSGLVKRPDNAQGPSGALPLGVVLGYAPEAVAGLELRGVFTGQVVGPHAIVLGAGARYAFPLLPAYRIFVGPELLLGTHVALGADKTARFLSQGSAFVAFGLGERVQLEVSGDLGAALGGSGTLVLGGATGRALVRF